MRFVSEEKKLVPPATGMHVYSLVCITVYSILYSTVERIEQIVWIEQIEWIEEIEQIKQKDQIKQIENIEKIEHLEQI